MTIRSRLRSVKSWWVWRRPPHRWQGGLIMGAMTVGMTMLIGMSGWRKYRTFRGRGEPHSFQESLIIGVVVGVIVFLLHTFNKWPYFDPWPRKPKAKKR